MDANSFQFQLTDSSVLTETADVAFVLRGYDGAWKDGIKHGQGRLKFEDGDVYDGEYENDKRHGQGRLEFASGAVYVGAWKDGKQHGQGRYEFANGDVYDGAWKDDKRHGHGRYESASGEVYVGEYEDNNRTGANHFSNEEKEAQRFRIEKEAPYDEIKYLLEQEGWIVKAAFFFGGYNITNPEGKKYQAETLSDLRELYRNIINPH